MFDTYIVDSTCSYTIADTKIATLKENTLCGIKAGKTTLNVNAVIAEETIQKKA